MTQDHSSKLSFSIEESVWLNKGQEVDEIVSLALDPEITVQENGEYVLIRGGLKLTGEYRCSSNGESTEDGTPSLSDRVGFRSIEEVTLNEDGTGEIRHHFPIDVTIPQERISSLDDIYVLVESFDYDLPERGCIQLTADVAITGMSNGQNATEDREVAVNDEIEVADQHVDEEPYTEGGQEEDRSFKYEAYSQEETAEERHEQEDTVVEFPNDEPPLEVSNSEEEKLTDIVNEERPEQQLEDIEQLEGTSQDEIENEEVVENRDLTENEGEIEDSLENRDEIEEVTPVEEVKVKSPSIAFGVVKDRPKLEVVAEDQVEAEKANPQKSLSMLKNLAGERNARQEVATEKAEVEVMEAEVPVDVEVQPEQTKEENALYLTKMLTKGEEKEFKKLKIAIIQENETLDVIASRYEVSQSTLIKVNRLNDASVEEGQILYIPVTQ